MSSGFIQVPLSASPVPVWSAQLGDEDVTFVNLDTVQIMYISKVNTFTVGGINTVPIPPQGNVTLDGRYQYWGASNASQPLLVLPGSAVWAGTGVTPYPSDTVLAESNPAVPASVLGGTTFTVYADIITGTSYQLAVDAFTAALTPTTPFYEVILLWKNNNVLVDLQHWVVLTTNVSPASSNSLFVVRGPTMAQHLGVLIKNYDTNPIALDYSLFQSSRVVTRHDGRQISNNISGSYTYNSTTFPTPNSEPGSLVLGNSPAVTINPSASIARINALWAGDAEFAFTCIDGGTNGTACTVSMVMVDPNYPGGSPVLNPFQPTIYTKTFMANAQVQQRVNLPRLPSMVIVTNSSGLDTLNFNYSLTGVELAV